MDENHRTFICGKGIRNGVEITYGGDGVLTDADVWVVYDYSPEKRSSVVDVLERALGYLRKEAS